MAAVTVRILGDAKGFRRATQSAQKSLGSFGKSAAKMAGIATGALATAGVAFIASGAKALIGLEELSAQTEAVLNSTGGTAGTTLDQVVGLASGIEKLTGIEQELVQSGENMLLTFTNVRNEVGKGNDIFDQATMAATDMSVALGTDLKGSAMILGKALNDPIKGIAKLKKIGVTFTDQQIEQVEAFVAAGDAVGAQGVILKEINKEFGGSAVAWGDTTAGSLAKVKNKFGDLSEEIARFVLPMLEKLGRFATDKVLPVLEDLGRAFTDDVLPQLKEFGGWISEKVLPVLADLGDAVGDKLVVEMKKLSTWIKDTAIPNLQNLWRWFTESILPVLKRVADYVALTLVPVLATITGWIIDVAVAALKKLVGWFSDLYGWFEKNKIATELLLVPLGTLLVLLAALKVASVVATAVGLLTIAIDAATASTAAWTAALLANPITWVVVAIVALVTAFVLAYQHVKWFRDGVDRFLDDVSGFVGDVIDDFETLWGWIEKLANWWDAGGREDRSLWDKFTNPMEIDLFHTGGTFRAPRAGGEGLAILRDGERVLTPGAPRHASSGGGVTVIVNVAGNVRADKDLARVIKNELIGLGRRGFAV